MYVLEALVSKFGYLMASQQLTVACRQCLSLGCRSRYGGTSPR